MEKNKIDLFLAVNTEKFKPEVIPSITETLRRMSDDQFIIIQSVQFRSPTTILIIAFLLGWERFFLDDVGMGILKIVTCYGLGIWWLVDLFSAKSRAQDYNYKKFNTLTANL